MIEQEVDPISKQRTSRTSTIAEITYSAIEVATRQVQWSNIVKLRVPGSPSQAAEPLSRTIGTEVTELLHPLRVVLTETTGTVVVNQGGRTLAAGQRLKLVALGNTITDPDTKETLGRLQTEIGEVEITKVDAAMSTGRVVSGNLDRRAEMILRRIETTPGSNAAPAKANPGTRSKAFD